LRCLRIWGSSGPSAAQPGMRSAPVWTFMEERRRKPTRVRPSSTASDQGADTAAKTGALAVLVFGTRSKDARPLTIENVTVHRRSVGQVCPARVPVITGRRT
jgi:hypothetical protein